MKVVILAAGFGSRLWPLSTSEKPKQFQPLLDGVSPLQYTSKLFAKVTEPAELYVLTLKGLEHLVIEQLPGFSARLIIAVPERRNTLPHTIFALNAIANAADEPILFVTVDHLILDEEAFVASVRRVVEDKEKRGLAHVTLLGNHSKVFDPNAGYFEADKSRHLRRFVEKPDKQARAELARAGNTVYKDTAMFIASQNAFAEALATFSDEISQQARALLYAPKSERTARFLALPFADIATGFYEKATNLHADFTAGDFVDLGSYGSLYKVRPKDMHDNVVAGTVFLERSSNNVIINQVDRPLVVINVHDAVVVQGEAGTVVAPRSDVNAVGEMYKTRIHDPGS